jgi:hypothetical protein
MNKFTREEMTNIIVASDIVGILEEASKGEYTFISNLIKGTSLSERYINYSDVDLKDMFKRLLQVIKDSPNSTRILALAHVLNGEPIDLLKS